MKILHVDCDDDFGALNFEQCHKLSEFVLGMEVGETKVDEEGFFYATLLEFGEVDPSFIKFIRNNMIDYDQSKNVNFYIVDAEEV